jgi:hypothetical protein
MENALHIIMSTRKAKFRCLFFPSPATSKQSIVRQNQQRCAWDTLCKFADSERLVNNKISIFTSESDKFFTS